MELNTRSFMIMAVTLVVGIVLITGVVAPVIGNVSSSGGGDNSGESFTNEGHGFLSATDQSTSVTFYPVSANKYSTDPDSVADRPLYDAPLFILANEDTYRIMVLEEVGGPSYFQVFSMDQGTPVTADMLTLSGTTLTFTPRGESTAVTKSNIIYYSSETGNYTYVTEKFLGDAPPTYGTYFALNNTPLYCFGLYPSQSFSQGAATFVISGTPATNTVTVYGADTHSDSAEITITDDQITDISFSIATIDISLNPGSLDENLFMFYMVLPVEVGGSDGGSDVPEYLSSLLSVIPLLMIVGLILGVVAFLRMKN